MNEWMNEPINQSINERINEYKIIAIYSLRPIDQSRN